MNLVGFDIFETLLARQTSPPDAVFLELGKALSRVYSNFPAAAIFGEQRRLAEMRCYASKGCSTTIYDIYFELADCLDLDADQVERMVELEFELEGRLLQPIESNIELLRKHRNNGDSIVFVSDMYLPSKLLREFLEINSISEPGELIYVSCEHGVDKRSGELFERVMETFRVKPERFQFYGNNFKADVQGALRAHVQPTHLTIGNPNRFEQILGEELFDTDGLSSLFAGASRRARILCDNSASNQAIVEVGAGVAAPLLISYVLWVLRKSRSMGINRLYFLSRDGEIMLKLAEILAPKMGFEVELRYLYASRCAWARGSKERSLGDWYLGDVNSSTSAMDLIARLGITWEAARATLEGLGFDQQRVKRSLSKADVESFKGILNSDEFAPIRSEAIERHRETLKRYFEQEGLLDHKAIGLVDVGWSGSLHEVAAEILEEEDTDSRTYGFLFGARRSEGRFTDRKLGFYFNENTKTGNPNPLPRKEFFILMEIFCSASHGTVTGYREKDGRIEAEIDANWDGTVEAWGFDTYRSAVFSVAKSLNLSSEDLGKLKLLRPALAKLVTAFWDNPSKRQTQIWGSFPWNCGQGGDSRFEPLARRRVLSKELACKAVKKFRSANMNRPWEWRQGSAALSSIAYKSVYFAPAFLGRIKKALRLLKDGSN